MSQTNFNILAKTSFFIIETQIFIINCAMAMLVIKKIFHLLQLVTGK